MTRLFLTCVLLLSMLWTVRAQSLSSNGALISISQNLVDFTGKSQNNSIILSWKTISDADKEYFSVQRSKDAVEWEDIGKASVSSNSSNAFEFTDKNPYENNTYYRLRIDYNGKKEFSSIISAKPIPEINKTILYPNPTKNVIWIKSEQTMNTRELIDLEVYNILGEKVYASKMQDDMKLDMTSYQNGYYCIKIGDKTYKVLKEE